MASKTDPPLNKLSKLISRVLSLPIKSIDEVLNCKNVSLLEEFLQLELQRLPGIETVVKSGSRADGTAFEDSDIDKMLVIQDVTVHTSQTNQERGRGSGFLFDTSGSPPGFGRLKLMYYDGTEHPIFKDEYMLQKTTDGNYLSSEMFLVSFLSGYRDNPFSVPYTHGPCIMIENDHLFRFGSKCPVIKVRSDIVFAFKCDQWPVEAKEWITRERRHDWPPKTVVETITSQNCHVVPTGDARSRQSHLEWRTSFILGERELVWNFNNTQVQCLVLLKMLLKKFIEPLAPDQLSSYHMKTIVFWLSEEKGLPMWTDANLLMCVTESLNMLKVCIEKGELQHYFHRQRNLLNYKLKDVKQKERVLLKIAEIQEDCVTHVLSCINRKEDLLGIWTRNEQNMTQFIEATKRLPYLHHGYTEKITITMRNISMYAAMNGVFLYIASYELDPLQILNHIKKLKENPPKGVMPNIIARTKKYLDLQLGMTFFKHTAYWSNQTEEYALLLISRAQYIDYLSGALYLASFKFNLKQFSSAIDTILSVLRQNKNLIYISSCSRNMSISLTPEGEVRQRPTLDFCGQGENHYIANDVIIPYWNLHFWPHPVKFECALEQYDLRIIRIHPCVYAYLLLCLGYYHLSDRAHFKVYLTHLEEAVTKTAGANERYRALNLLGYCYYLDRKMNDALKYFIESLQETRDFPFFVNAAVYHICIMIVSVRDEQMLR